jgi:integrase/recombinase XerD
MTDLFKAYLTNRKSELTVKNYLSTLERYEEWLRGKGPDEKNAEEFIMHLSLKGNSTRSLNRHLSALKTFFKKVLKRDLNIDGYLIEKNIPIWLLPDEQDKMIASCQSKYEKAIVVLFLKTGVRVSEACTVTPDSFIKTPDGYYLKIMGKGSKERLIPTSEAVVQVVADYVAISGTGDGVIFNRGVNELEDVVQAVAKRAGIKKHVTCHKLRHSYASRYYAETKDIAALRDNLGHSDIATTGIYTHVDSVERLKKLPDSMKKA